MKRRNRKKSAAKRTIATRGVKTTGRSVKDVIAGVRARLLSFGQLVKRMNWRGRLIVFGVPTLVIAAVVVTVVLTTGTGAAAQQTAALPTPQPTLAPVVTPQSTPTPIPIPTTPPEQTEDPTLEKGDENESVAALQNRLMDLGYLDIDDATMYFGSATQYAVELFQRQHELQQDGIAGVQTLLMIYDDTAKPYTLLEGTRGTDVDSLQRQLERMGYLDKVTGYYGTETVEAVKAFQKRNGLTVDGKTGEHTLDKIYSPDAKASPDVEAQERSRANILKMVETAKAQLGKPYVLGNEGPNSFDCSGLVYYCLKAAGSSRGRYNAAGYSKVTDWEKIESMNDMEIGDLMFFWSSSKGKVGHVAIYVGGGMMIDASTSNGKVVYRSCRTSYWERVFVYARRPW